MLATFANAISIGIVGVAVIGPLAQPENPLFGIDVEAAVEKFGSLTNAPPIAVIEWNAIFVALLVHGVAHVILRAQVDDE